MGEVRHVLPQGAGGGGRAARTPTEAGEGWRGGDTIGGGSANPESGLYIYIYIYICMYVCLSVCLSVRLSVCLSVYLSVCLYVCMYVYMYMYVHMCIIIFIYVCIYNYLCTNICSKHIYMHILASRKDSTRTQGHKDRSPPIVPLYRPGLSPQTYPPNLTLVRSSFHCLGSNQNLNPLCSKIYRSRRSLQAKGLPKATSSGCTQIP